MRHAFGEVCGRADALDAMDFRGMTDSLIFEGGLTAIGRASDAELVDALKSAYLTQLALEVPRSPDYRILPGVPDLITELLTAPNYALGLGTGNIEAGARTKLARGELSSPFAFGGFGDDGRSREDLVLAGATRGAATLGVPLEEARVVIIGDTPRDAEAARWLGAECLGVETGGHAEADLRAAGARWVVEDLRDPAARAALLGQSV